MKLTRGWDIPTRSVEQLLKDGRLDGQSDFLLQILNLIININLYLPMEFMLLKFSLMA